MKALDDISWRESIAVSEMHARLARDKLWRMSSVEDPNWDRRITEIGKSVESLEKAIDAAKKAHVELCAQFRRQSPYAPRGVVSVKK